MPDLSSKMDARMGTAAASEDVSIPDAAALSEQAKIRAHRLANHDRQEDVRKHVHKLVCWLIDILGVIFLAAVVIRAWHLLIPQWGWLKPDQEHDIDKLVISGFVGSFFGQYVRKAFGEDGADDEKDTE